MIELEPVVQLRGVAAASGIAIGPAFWLETTLMHVQRRQVDDIGQELLRLTEARRRARAELEQLQSHVAATISVAEAGIFEAHLAFLDDPVLFDEVEERCRLQQCNIETALSEVFDRYSGMLQATDDELFRARANDLLDVKRRLLRLLIGSAEQRITLPDESCIVLAEDLLPSEVVQLDRSRVLGICLTEGGPTSHVAILARSLGLPAIVGLGKGLAAVKTGTLLVVDGSAGLLVVNPSDQTLQSYRAQYERERNRRIRERAAAQSLATTHDGVRIAVLANLSSLAEVEEAVANGAEGVGLLRTELLFLDRDHPPSEEEQLSVYNRIAAALGERPLVIRTLDIGGDKPVPYLRQPPEQNPALGVRGVRLAQHDPELLRMQIRAIWRIETNRSVKVMFPMVSTLEEVYWLRKLVIEVGAELRAAGIATLDRLEMGVMIEVPALALMVDHVSRVVDFISIGTNDLTQYAVAVDRNNMPLHKLGDSLHPAILRLVAHIVRTAEANGAAVSVCGEAAGDQLGMPLLVGLGVKTLSVSPALIPGVKAALHTLNSIRARAVAEHAMNLATAAEVRAYAGTVWSGLFA
ncbi:phosphoenolpyruvate--protein phosphotransferase [Chloroflexus sp.]|uniref:phosphoenolpyruvate--protein phosphotransferase n=1 Tax=Chloroflexus sp. TaxID=1904827 RepID=UPI00298F351A|nr:phosphoenolpyruvate--protein phosphotransferase [Chloroflexus sp.]MDW8403478.1 phosphoenolpyruvate--protein phosphotransferase [Chloroflexus sp.]